MLRWILLATISFAGCAHASLYWHWHAPFSPLERDKLKHWIHDSNRGLTRLFGEIPMDFHIHFERLPNRGEPVPWARTNKGRGASVYFHVDTRYSLAAFKRDWTASHELAHLLFPYLGEDGRWFAEGIASYLQYPIMYASGTLNWEQAVDRYRERFHRAGNIRIYDDVSIVELSRRKFGKLAYVRMYWGGAAYFARVDKRLADSTNKRLNDVITDYLHCCYQPWGVDARAMMRTLDRLSDTDIFWQTYLDTVLRPGFPPIGDVLDWLAANPPPLQSLRNARE